MSARWTAASPCCWTAAPLRRPRAGRGWCCRPGPGRAGRRASGPRRARPWSWPPCTPPGSPTPPSSPSPQAARGDRRADRRLRRPPTCSATSPTRRRAWWSARHGSGARCWTAPRPRRGLRFVRAAGIVHQAQPPETLGAGARRSRWRWTTSRLAGLAFGAALFGSAVLAIALQRGWLERRAGLRALPPRRGLAGGEVGRRRGGRRAHRAPARRSRDAGALVQGAGRAVAAATAFCWFAALELSALRLIETANLRCAVPGVVLSRCGLEIAAVRGVVAGHDVALDARGVELEDLARSPEAAGARCGARSSLRSGPGRRWSRRGGA